MNEQFINPDFAALYNQQLLDYQQDRMAAYQDRQLSRTVNYLQAAAAILAIIGILYSISRK